MLGQDGGLSLTIAQIVQRLKGSGLHSQLEQQARLSLHRPDIRLESLKEDIKEFLKTSGWEKKLQNAVYSELSVFPSPCHPSVPPEHIKESLTYMRKAQGNWEKRILKSLNSMCTELGIPLAQKRSVNDQMELLTKWNEMGTDEPDLSLFRPVYAPKDFLEVLMNLRNPNYENSEQPSFRNHLGLIQVPLRVKDIPDLKEYFSELDLNTGQLDIDDSAHVPPELFENDHVRIGQKVLAEQDSAAAQQYVRQGCPTSLRAELWVLILNVSNQPEMQRFRTPVVDAPVAAIGSSSVLPVDSDGLPRDPVDRRIEQAVRRAFDAAAGSLRASVAGSMFSRAVFLWIRELLADFDVPAEPLSPGSSASPSKEGSSSVRRCSLSLWNPRARKEYFLPGRGPPDNSPDRHRSFFVVADPLSEEPNPQVAPAPRVLTLRVPEDPGRGSLPFVPV
ncbi:hypothetical protein lerEdw1_019147, partial [Lerista edwardsae]